MLIDVTTINNIYNTIGPQASWHKHAFGKRNYPEKCLSISEIKKLNNNTAILKSFYGDAFLHPYIRNIIDYFKSLKIYSYGMYGEELYKYAVNRGCEIIFEIDGFRESCGQVFLGSDWKVLERNINICGDKCHILFHIFEHNKQDLKKLQKFATEKNIQIKIQDFSQKNIFPIINKNGVWMYDVLSRNSDNLKHYLGLKRHLHTYEFLRTLTNPPRKKSIMEQPLIPKFNLGNYDIIDDITVITPTGHVFQNQELYTMFMYMLGDDWDVGLNTVKESNNEYLHRILFFAQKILEKDLDEYLIENVFKDHQS